MTCFKWINSEEKIQFAEVKKGTILRSNITLSTEDSGVDLAIYVVRTKLCQPKIRNFGIEVVIKEDVACLEVTMNHWRTYKLMQIL